MPIVTRPLEKLVATICAGAALLAAGCSDGRHELRMFEPVAEIDRKIAGEFAAVMQDQSPISIELVGGSTDRQPAIDALLADRVDIALVSNNRPYTPDIATVMPLYPSVLHILAAEYLVNAGPVDAEARLAVFTTGRVFAGPPDSPSRVMLLEYADEQGIGPGDIRFMESFGSDNCPDIIAVFAPIVRDMRSLIEECNASVSYKLQNLEAPERRGDESPIEAAILFNPSLRSFVIPARTYGDITPKPVATLAVDKMLVARHDVPSAVIYDLVSEVLRLRPALAAVEPSLFFGLDGKFDSSDSTFILHAGAQSYIERDEPSVYERYSGIAEVAVTLFVALLSGSIAAARIYNIRRKNRIDVFYAGAIEVRRSVNDTATEDERRNAISKIRVLQTRAFEMLVDEKLAADESFRIFITLSNDIIGELKDPTAPDWSTPGEQ